MQEFLFKYGLPGAVIFALGWYVLLLEERHRKERDEWRKTQEKESVENRQVQEKQFDRINEMSNTSNQVTRENTSILSGLKTLLEHQNKR